MAGVLCLDLAPDMCGFCAGSGHGAPEAGAFHLTGVTADLGLLATSLEDMLAILIDRHQPEAISYESPILKSTDKLQKIRCIYGLGFEVERTCARKSIECGEINLRRIKSFATGDQYAEKKDVADAMERIGITLPAKASEGRLDAGDAAAGWLLHLSEFDPAAASPWIARLRGSLL